MLNEKAITISTVCGNSVELVAIDIYWRPNQCTRISIAHLCATEHGNVAVDVLTIPLRATQAPLRGTGISL